MVSLSNDVFFCSQLQTQMSFWHQGKRPISDAPFFIPSVLHPLVFGSRSAKLGGGKQTIFRGYLSNWKAFHVCKNYWHCLRTVIDIKVSKNALIYFHFISLCAHLAQKISKAYFKGQEISKDSFYCLEFIQKTERKKISISALVSKKWSIIKRIEELCYQLKLAI